MEENQFFDDGERAKLLQELHLMSKSHHHQGERSLLSFSYSSLKKTAVLRSKEANTGEQQWYSERLVSFFLTSYGETHFNAFPIFALHERFKYTHT